MRIFGIPIPFTGERKALSSLSSLPYASNFAWSYPIIHEPFPGAWQRNISINTESAASFHADFACKTLIARDIAKLRVKLAEKDANDIWSETTNPAFSPVLRRPNDYQTRNQFWESWVLSKLSRGNTYVLKVRDNRQVVTGLHVLDPTQVQPLVADDGAVFYRLSSDNLAGVGEITVPAREIIHDRMNCLFHPLVGTPPVFASGLASMLGLNAQNASALLFENASMPGGLLIAPGEVSEVEEKRIKEEWEQRFSRVNLGRVAVMTGGMKYEKLQMTHVEGQMIEQLKWSAEVVCSVYHVPPYKVGVGALPSYNNVQALNVEYYSQALQSHIEEIEELLDHALGIGWAESLGTEFDTDTLLRMDSTTQTTVIRDAVGAGVMSPNEGRSKLDLKPVTGGESPYLQQQNYSLAALAKRDAQPDPFAPAKPPPPPPGPPAAPAPPTINDDAAEKFATIARMFTSELKAAAGFPAPATTETEEKLGDMADIFAWELKDAARISHGPQ
jgi:HK97 family phage portal protein